MYKRITSILLFLLFPCSYFIFASPVDAFADKYQLTSADGQIRVIFNSRFGGAITELYDSTNFGSENLIDYYEGGSLLQTCFWNPIQHPLEKDCVGGSIYNNPTQGGFGMWADRGNNRIGYLGGYYSNTGDPEEFIVYENNNSRVHLKSRFARWDYCQVDTPDDQRSKWDSYWYIEQWASFDPEYSRTLVLRSKITYVGTGYPTPGSGYFDVNSKQFPVLFGRNLEYVGFWQNGQKQVVVAPYFKNGSLGFNPDQDWAALIALIGGSLEAGIGIVQPNVNPQLNRAKFTTQSQGELDNRGYIGVILYAGSGTPNLDTMGVLTNAYLAWDNHVYRFNTGGSFEWTTYFPVGTLDQIKQASEGILLRSVPTPTNTPPMPTPTNTQPPQTPTPVLYLPIGGFIRNSATGNGINNVSVVISDDELGTSRSVTTDANGIFVIFNFVRDNDHYSVRPNTALPGFQSPETISGGYNWCVLDYTPFGSTSYECQRSGYSDCGTICDFEYDPTIIPTPTPTPIPGDVDGNRLVNAADMLLVFRSWLGTGSCSSFNCNLNGDNKVNSLDAALVIANFGK